MKDEFFAAEVGIRNQIEEVRQKQEERNKLKLSPDDKDSNLKRIKLSNDVKKKLEEIQDTLKEMDKILARQEKTKDANEADFKRKEQILKNFKKMLENLKERENDINILKRKATEVETEYIFDKVNNGDPLQQEELTTEEIEAIERWRQQDEKQDELLNDVCNGQDEMVQGMAEMNEGIKSNNKIMAGVYNDFNRCEDQFKKTNKSLKGILDKHRHPSKVCLDICLIQLILTQVGIQIGVSTK